MSKLKTYLIIYYTIITKNYRITRETRDWEHLIKGIWKLKEEERCNIMTVELSMRKLFKGTDFEIQHNSN